MNDVFVEQRSSEWYRLRRTGVTASDVGAVIGVSKYATAKTVWEGKLASARNSSETEATSFGARFESNVVAAYAELTHNTIESAGFYWHKDAPAVQVGASPDGFVIDNVTGERGVLEVKCPLYRELPYIPCEYMSQIQVQLEVCDLPWGDFCVYSHRQQSLRIWRVYRSKAYWNWMLPKLIAFCEHLRERTLPVDPVLFGDISAASDALSRNAFDYSRISGVERARLPRKVHVEERLNTKHVIAEVAAVMARRAAAEQRQRNLQRVALLSSTSSEWSAALAFASLKQRWGLLRLALRANAPTTRADTASVHWMRCSELCDAAPLSLETVIDDVQPRMSLLGEMLNGATRAAEHADDDDDELRFESVFSESVPRLRQRSAADALHVSTSRSHSPTKSAFDIDVVVRAAVRHQSRQQHLRQLGLFGAFVVGMLVAVMLSKEHSV
jgi:putative phage-type endonuclease